MATVAQLAQAVPIRLHPENPHYFLWRGEPTVLVTSGEHYGAVLNLDFDYATYLRALQTDGLNNTRMFVGAYVEPQGAFNIARNSLAPAPGRFICPWARSDTPGYANGGNKFDLDRWDDAYFERLRDFVRAASDCGVVVEVNLFCPFYGEEQWALSPMNTANNINGVGAVNREAPYTLTGNGGLLPYQEALVRKVVTELRAFDNLYYEIMNEPYIKGVPEDWQRRIAEVIVAAEDGPGERHLISQNIANGKAAVTDPNPAVSILNFHYAWPPDTVAMNYALNRVIGDNETGFKGSDLRHYRMEGWEFMLAGGGLYNNLDYSFTAGHEDGTFRFPESQPGSGGPVLRRQLGILKRFLDEADVIRLAPRSDVAELREPQAGAVRVLAAPEGRTAAYVRKAANAAESPVTAALALRLPDGAFEVEWVRTESGERVPGGTVHVAGAPAVLESPAFDFDIALRVRPAAKAE